MPLFRARLALLIAAAGFYACSPNTVCKLAGPINDPSNRTLRRSIMNFGLDQFCQQMPRHNAPLKLTPDAPIVGRFYPQHCQQQQLDNGDLWVHFDGDRKSTRLNSSHNSQSRMPSSA